MIRIQTEDFSVAEEYQKLRAGQPEKTGAIATFTGLVRDYGDGHGVSSLELEHYEGMTQKSLAKIISKAQQRWTLLDVTVIHRIGLLHLSEQIVFVGVSTPHRKDAFQACEYIMDYLKTEAPLWKKEVSDKGQNWVDTKNSDKDQVHRWEEKKP